MACNTSNKTVYVLGAGCSKNYNSPETARGLKPPVDADFFKMAARVLLQHNKIPQRFSNLILETKHLYHFKSSEVEHIIKEWLSSRMSLESTFTFIDLEAEKEEGLSNVTLRTAREELLKIIRLTFYRTLKGPPCNVHSRLVQHFRQSDSVISYNYDILADNALFYDHKLNENNYLVPFRRVFYQGSWMSPRQSVSSMKLIKLHGSLNWLHCKKCSSLLCFLGEKTPEDYSSGQPTLVNCPHCDSNELEYILIPPILHKRYNLPGMPQLWEEAEAELSKADRVVVIGYSLPPTDFRSELLFRSALGERNFAIDIVNPRKRVLNRFKSIFRPVTNRVTFSYYSSLNEYLDRTQGRALVARP
jgi:NAD-dependent SIR2 family protein deacetylase